MFQIFISTFFNPLMIYKIPVHKSVSTFQGH